MACAFVERLNFQRCSEAEGFLTFCAFKMCFAPQHHALFQHLNFQKCSKHGLPLAFWLGNLLRTPAACTFSTQLPDLLRTCYALYMFFAPKRRAFFNMSTSTSKSAPNLFPQRPTIDCWLEAMWQTNASNHKPFLKTHFWEVTEHGFWIWPSPVPENQWQLPIQN